MKLDGKLHRAVVPLLETIEHQLDAARHSQFVKNFKQVVSYSNPAYVVDLGTGALRWVSIGCLVSAILNAMLGWVAGRYFGGTAVVAASVFSLALGYVIVVISYHHKNRQPFGVLLPRESTGIIITSLAGGLIFLPFFCSVSTDTIFSVRITFGVLAALLTMIVVPMWVHPIRKRFLQYVLARLPA